MGEVAEVNWGTEDPLLLVTSNFKLHRSYGFDFGIYKHLVSLKFAAGGQRLLKMIWKHAIRFWKQHALVPFSDFPTPKAIPTRWWFEIENVPLRSDAEVWQQHKKTFQDIWCTSADKDTFCSHCTFLGLDEEKKDWTSFHFANWGETMFVVALPRFSYCLEPEQSSTPVWRGAAALQAAPGLIPHSRGAPSGRWPLHWGPSCEYWHHPIVSDILMSLTIAPSDETEIRKGLLMQCHVLFVLDFDGCRSTSCFPLAWLRLLLSASSCTCTASPLATWRSSILLSPVSQVK